MRASEFFSDEEKRTIAAAVAQAEESTAGEIVPVVATASGRYDRAEDLFGLLLAVVAVAVAWVLFQEIRPVEGDWASGQMLVLGLVPILVIFAAAFLLGAVVATYVPVLRLPFISSAEMADEVERSAQAAFQRFRIRKTEGGTGVLIYVSLYEHMVRVLGDDTIGAKLSQADWDEVCNLASTGLREKRGAEGLAQAIARCGELLSRHFPFQPGDRNELTNELCTID